MVAAVLASRRPARIRPVRSIVIVIVVVGTALAYVMYRSSCCAYDNGLGIPSL